MELQELIHIANEAEHNLSHVEENDDEYCGLSVEYQRKYMRALIEAVKLLDNAQ